MGLIDQMKYAKILYLADVLEDIQEEMRKDWRMRSYAISISDIVKDLRQTIADNTVSPMEYEKVKIKRLECARPTEFVPPLYRDEYEEIARHNAINDLLNYIKENKLIHIHKSMNDMNTPTFTASLIVGIEKDPAIPTEEP